MELNVYNRDKKNLFILWIKLVNYGGLVVIIEDSRLEGHCAVFWGKLHFTVPLSTLEYKCL